LATSLVSGEREVELEGKAASLSKIMAAGNCDSRSIHRTPVRVPSFLEVREARWAMVPFTSSRTQFVPWKRCHPENLTLAV